MGLLNVSDLECLAHEYYEDDDVETSSWRRLQSEQNEGQGLPRGERERGSAARPSSPSLRGPTESPSESYSDADQGPANVTNVGNLNLIVNFGVKWAPGRCHRSLGQARESYRYT